MQAKMAVARIKLLRNKRQAVVKQMRRDIALLLQSGQDATARIRVLNTFYYSFSYHSNLKFMAFWSLCSKSMSATLFVWKNSPL